MLYYIKFYAYIFGNEVLFAGLLKIERDRRKSTRRGGRNSAGEIRRNPATTTFAKILPTSLRVRSCFTGLPYWRSGRSERNHP